MHRQNCENLDINIGQALNVPNHSMWVSYKWQTKTRYYNIHLQPNLLGLCSVICDWGGIKNKLGGFETKIFDSYDEAIDYINELNQKRKQRKYELTQII